MAKKNDVLKRIDEMFTEASAYRQTKESEWKENERFYRGNQWRYAENRPVKNWCFTIVEGELPILTDTRPAPAIIPVEQEMADDAKILDSAIKYVFEQQDYQLKMTQAVKKALIAGPSWQFVDYDPEGENGEGVITIRNIGWQFVWVDPSADDIEAAGYAIIDEPIRVEDLKRMFPKHANKIEARPEQQESENNNYYVDPTRWQPDMDGGDTVNRYGGKNMTSYRKTWMKDYSMQEIDEDEVMEMIEYELETLMDGKAPIVDQYMNHEMHISALENLLAQVQAQPMQPEVDEMGQPLIDETGNMVQDSGQQILAVLIQDAIDIHNTYAEDNPTGKRPKYTNNWRLVITTNSNSLVLYDGTPDVDDGMIPLVPYYCYKNDDVYGTSEVQNIKDAQKSFNDMDWAEYKGLRLNSNSGWIKDVDSGVDDSLLTNEEGIVVTKNKGTEVRRLEPGVVSPQLNARMNTDQSAIEQISGVNEATQGRRPAGVTAAKAIRFLQEQSIGRIRLKTRYLEEYSVPRLGWLVASRIQKYWTSERKLRIYDGNGRIQHIDYSPEEIRKLKYEVKSVPGSTAGLDKESIFTLFEGLLAQGVITPKTFVSNVDIPYKAKILEDMEENDEQMAMMEQLAAENAELKAQLGIPQEMVAQ